ncbi:IS701 family transposase [Limnoglobus roseus]|uniref:Transposase n=1 Tax=Limnoglobus roseus TaxID=2598579 RepID=A0A5C1AGG9_9BACT|nr:IS701 family transposase [Limnoglobus roseus]QEL17735.1 transposase [Limnoglobus roseus]
MDARKLTKLRRDLTAFLDAVVGTLGNARRRRWCDAYLRGILLDGHRKSVEPMAARLRAIERGGEDYDQALQQFLNQSPWDADGVRDGLQAWIARQFGTGGVVIIDDTGFPKQGAHSVGVARQYTGTLGKVASCQVAVTLQFATAKEVVGLDVQLYLPQAWADDADRMARAGVPTGVGYQPKWQMALAMLRRAAARGFRGVVLADSLFGTVTEFREQLAADGRTYYVGIDSTLKVVAADADLGAVPPAGRTGRPPTRPAGVRAGAKSPSAKQWSVERTTDFRAVTWRKGTKGKMTGRFAAWRVRPAHKLSSGREPGAACWLLAEWPADAAESAKYFFSNLPAGASLKRLVATAKTRWWVEHSYRELKDELGLDHFEGRSWRGWNHHAVLVLMACAFLQNLRRTRRKKVPPA